MSYQRLPDSKRNELIAEFNEGKINPDYEVIPNKNQKGKYTVRRRKVSLPADQNVQDAPAAEPAEENQPDVQPEEVPEFQDDSAYFPSVCSDTSKDKYALKDHNHDDKYAPKEHGHDFNVVQDTLTLNMNNVNITEKREINIKQDTLTLNMNNVSITIKNQELEDLKARVAALENYFISLK